MFLADSEIIDSAGITYNLNSPTYEGALIGPTLRLKPGDSLDLNMINNFPPNPALRMQPGEVQRWRMLNAASGLTLPVALEVLK